MGFAISTWGHTDHAQSGPLKAHLVFKNKMLHVHASMAQMPSAGQQEAFLNLEILNEIDHAPINSLDQIEVVLWMPDMNHGSAPTQVTRKVNPQGNVLVGQYVVSNMYFIMAGLWEIQITLTDSLGMQEMRKFTVLVPGDSEHH